MHTHGGESVDPKSPEERRALLDYMVKHNRSHAEELHDLAHALDGEASTLVHEAVELMNQSNDKLAEALKLLEA